MELERKMKRKLLAGVGIFILLALAGTWYADEAEKPPLVLQAKQESAEKQAGTTEVIGLQQAIAGGELRNPFSFVHEREGEIVQGAMPALKIELPSAAPPAAVAAEKQSNVPAAPAISLCGIVEGNGQRLALLRVGSNTVTAAVGEWADGWQVTGIGTATVTVERSGQVLSLNMSETGAK